MFFLNTSIQVYIISEFMGIIRALMSFVSKCRRFWFFINSQALKKWYVWLSGSIAGIIRAKKKVENIKSIKEPNNKINDLSNKRALINLLISKLGFR